MGSCKLGSEKTSGPAQTLATAATVVGLPTSALNRFEDPPCRNSQKRFFPQNWHFSNIISQAPEICAGPFKKEREGFQKQIQAHPPGQRKFLAFFVKSHP